MNIYKLNNFMDMVFRCFGMVYIVTASPYPIATGFGIAFISLLMLLKLNREEEKARQGEKTSKAGPKQKQPTSFRQAKHPPQSSPKHGSPKLTQTGPHF